MRDKINKLDLKYLTYLNLEGNGVQDLAASKLIKSLNKCGNLLSLVLNKNNLGEKSALELKEMLPTSIIQNLELH